MVKEDFWTRTGDFSITERLHCFGFSQHKHVMCENCPPLDYYAASSLNFLLTFRDSISVPSSRVKNPILAP